MSAYSETTFNTQNYDEFRPTYNDELFSTVLEYHKGGHSLAIDLGCGSGQATLPLAEHFDKIIGTDVSQVMVDEANNKITDELKGKIEFRQSAAESLSFIEDESVDLVTAAECAHWFDHPAFFKEINRILKPNGTLAIWAYGDPVIDYNAEATEQTIQFTYEDPTKLGSYWQQPGRGYLRNLFRDIVPTPDTQYKDLKVYEHIAQKRPLPGHPDTDSPFRIIRDANLEYYGNYIKTWSSYHSWKKQNVGKEDIADVFIKELEAKFGWNKATKITLDWMTVLKLVRKR